MEIRQREPRKHIPPPSIFETEGAERQPVMLPIPPIPKSKSLSREIPPPVATHLSLAELRTKVEGLRESLERSRKLVAEEEGELAAQAEAIAQLQAKVGTARGLERLNLEVELPGEKEKWELLEATLVGQRQTLNKQKAVYEEHWRALQQRQSKEKPIPLKLPVPKLEAAAAVQESSEKLEKPRRHWRQWTLVLVAAGILTTGATVFYSLKLAPRQPSATTTATAEVAQSTAVSAIGYLEPAGEAIALSAPSSPDSARVAKLLVQQGEPVKAGQVVAVLDTRDRLQAALEQAKSQVKIARSRLDQVKAGAKAGEILAQDAKSQRTQAELTGQIAAQQAEIASQIAQLQGEKRAQQATIERIRAEWRNAQADCQRYQRLYQDGAVSVQERDRTCLKQETAGKNMKEANANLQRIVNTWQERIDGAKANLNRTVVTLQKQFGEERAMLNSVAEVRPIDVQVAQAELQAAETAVRRSQADLATAYVRSPRNGRILKIYARPGEAVSDKGIVELGETDRMYVKAEVYETDIRRVRAGQRATIKSEGIFGDLSGTVDEIGWQVGKQSILGTDPAADVDARVVEVKIRLSPQDSQRVAGLTNLQVNVIIDTLPNKNSSR